MDIKKTLREAILKKQKRKYDYGCVMVGLNTDTDKWNEIQNRIDEDDLYFGDGENGGYGRELDCHVTILFGVHEDVKDDKVETLIGKIKKPELTLKKISSFENEKFDVLKFDVESQDLHELNKTFKTLPHTTDFQEYQPHATICYNLKGKAKKYIKKLNDYIVEHGPIKMDATKIIYSKPDGTKKEYEFK